MIDLFSSFLNRSVSCCAVRGCSCVGLVPKAESPLGIQQVRGADESSHVSRSLLLLLLLLLLPLLLLLLLLLMLLLLLSLQASVPGHDALLRSRDSVTPLGVGGGGVVVMSTCDPIDEEAADSDNAKPTYYFDKILDHNQTKSGQYKFQVQWNNGEITWEPERHLREDSPGEFAACEMPKQALLGPRPLRTLFLQV